MGKKRYRPPSLGNVNPTSHKTATQEDLAEGKHCGAVPAGDAQGLFAPFTETIDVDSFAGASDGAK